MTPTMQVDANEASLGESFKKRAGLCRMPNATPSSPPSKLRRSIRLARDASAGADDAHEGEQKRVRRKRVAALELQKDQQVTDELTAKEDTSVKVTKSKRLMKLVTTADVPSLPPTRERALLATGYKWVFGIDEAGRGPLAGPVVAASCYVPLDVEIPGLQDSKRVQAEDREEIYERIISTPGVLYAVSVVNHTRIDEINILQATLEGMRGSFEACLQHQPLVREEVYALVDGNRGPDLGDFAVECVIKGDTKIRAIAAASILAKVTRDRIMVEYDAQWPVYGFAIHKGYPTVTHRAAILKYGPCPIHRFSYSPIKSNP